MKDETPTSNDLGQSLRSQLRKLLEGGQAHATFDSAVKDLPEHLRGEVPSHLPYSAWQILEHIRIAQRDILDFSNNSGGDYKHRKWPEEYWPKDAEPPSTDAWEQSIQSVRDDCKAFYRLIEEADDAKLVEPFPWGEDHQSLLREAFLIADHTAYHTGELIVLRRLLGVWKK